MELYKFEEYVTEKENLHPILEKYGVAIIPNVLTAKECDKMLTGLWNFLERITDKWKTPISRQNSLTWKSFFDLFPLHSMLLQHWGIGQSQACWEIRQNIKIIDIFAYFWNVDKQDLLVSFDGCSMGLPPEVTGRGWNRNKPWYHTDQSYTRNNFECMQSWITAVDVNEGDGTLDFLEGSHLLHKDFAKKFNIANKSDWHKLTDQELEFYNSCPRRKIKCPKGSMVFWDSRTIHCGAEPLKARKNPNLRSVIYLCYMPRKYCSESNIKKRIRAFKELRTTNHWPTKPKLFAKMPRTYGRTILKCSDIDLPALTSLGKRLVGFK